MANLKIDKLTSLDLQSLLSFIGISCMLVALFAISVSIINHLSQHGWQLFLLTPQILSNYLHSPLAIVYNLAILIAGIGCLLCSICLALLKINAYFQLVAIFSSATAITLILQGIFPSNYLAINSVLYYCWIICSTLLFLLVFVSYMTQQQVIGIYMLTLSALGFFSGLLLLGQLNFHQFTIPTCQINGQDFCKFSVIMWLHFQISLWWFVMMGFKCRQLAIGHYQRHARSQLYG